MIVSQHFVTEKKKIEVTQLLKRVVDNTRINEAILTTRNTSSTPFKLDVNTRIFCHNMSCRFFCFFFWRGWWGGVVPVSRSRFLKCSSHQRQSLRFTKGQFELSLLIYLKEIRPAHLQNIGTFFFLYFMTSVVMAAVFFKIFKHIGNVNVKI